MIVDITSPTSGKIWMDRNLGASRAATSSTDSLAYGDLFQWGRRSDGHQCRNSNITSTLSSIDRPTNSNFILTSNSPNDWRIPQNTNLWQGVNGINNPCPSGYRLPTNIELQSELSWNNSAGAFASPLKLPVAGGRSNNGSLSGVGIGGLYWSSTIVSTASYALQFTNNNVVITVLSRGYGFSVRCIKD
jgi:uncharacterized protein (TIGR02145 family)